MEELLSMRKDEVAAERRTQGRYRCSECNLSGHCVHGKVLQQEQDSFQLVQVKEPELSVDPDKHSRQVFKNRIAVASLVASLPPCGNMMGFSMGCCYGGAMVALVLSQLLLRLMTSRTSSNCSERGQANLLLFCCCIACTVCSLCCVCVSLSCCCVIFVCVLLSLFGCGLDHFGIVIAFGIVRISIL